MKHLVLAAGLAVATMGGAATQAKADYVSAVLRNPSNVTIHYQVKWGENGTWKSYELKPDFRRYHAFEIDDDGYAPDLYVRFDAIGNDGQISYKTYKVMTFEVSNAWNGKPHVFEWNGRLLDLFKD